MGDKMGDKMEDKMEDKMGDKTIKNKSLDFLAQKAIKRAELWQGLVNEELFREGRGGKFNFLFKLRKIIQDSSHKNLLVELLDQSFRSGESIRVVDQIRYILSRYEIFPFSGVRAFFSFLEKILLSIFLVFAPYFSRFFLYFFVRKIRSDSSFFVVPREGLRRYLKGNEELGFRTNINEIGDGVLGEGMAERQMRSYIERLEDEGVEYISIKVSTIYSQISYIGMEETVEELSERLRRLYRVALGVGNGGRKKFINLDMEEYRDIGITYRVFMGVLLEEEFLCLEAGVVLQAYLPDSYIWQRRLIDWSLERVSKGGARVKVRIVKGANREMELTESGLNGWELPTYSRKVDTDSNYKRILNEAFKGENMGGLIWGVASHNIFDLAYAYELAEEEGVLEYIHFEVLQGMGFPIGRVIHGLKKDLIIYAPTCSNKHFTNAIAYLVRRLDENSSRDNFMRYLVNLNVGSKEWEFLKGNFLDSVRNIGNLSVGIHRRQDRLEEGRVLGVGGGSIGYNLEDYQFKNEANTDFTLEVNQEWALQIKKKWESCEVQKALIVLGEREIFEDRRKYPVFDKSLGMSKRVGDFVCGNKEDIQEAFDIASRDEEGWSQKTLEERFKILSNVANYFRKDRGDLIGIASAEVGKVFMETDAEISEAIDFLRFYPYSLRDFRSFEMVESKPLGVGGVISPWNFPIAIPVGGIASALASGNRVIFKPSLESVLCGWALCQCFWKAGVSRKVLQFLPLTDELAGLEFVMHPKLDFLIFTGSDETAKSILMSRPHLKLAAETGGKNAIIVTNICDKEKAITDICISAFSNSGQKCSASSLLILEKGVYRDSEFKEMLLDATSSLEMGSVWNLKNTLGPLIDSPNSRLKKAIENIEDHESWFLEPEMVGGDSKLLKPSIRWGTKVGDYTQKTELFGPMLSVMEAKDLKEAIDIVHESGYGLTSGLYSLDSREKDYWLKNIQAGNLYINRPITGAMVLRQPFGGIGKSAIGIGRKAGFFNYSLQFLSLENHFDCEYLKKYLSLKTYPWKDFFDHPLQGLLTECYQSLSQEHQKKYILDFKKASLALKSYSFWYDQELSQCKDYTKIRGEDNEIRYRAVKRVWIRIHFEDDLFDILSRILACRIGFIKFIVSIDPKSRNENWDLLSKYHELFLGDGGEMILETDQEIAESIDIMSRIRYASRSRISDFVALSLAKKGIYIIGDRPLIDGRFELLNYFFEQSISHSYHRYGNLGSRSDQDD